MSDKEPCDTHPPYRRKNGYLELEEKIDNLAESVKSQLRRFFTKALAAFAVLGVTSAGALLGFGIVLSEQDETSEMIQQQRFNTIFQNCEQQNLRHNNAISKAKTLSRETQRIVIMLVDELQPFDDDCEGLAASRVSGGRDADRGR